MTYQAASLFNLLFKHAFFQTLTNFQETLLFTLENKLILQFRLSVRVGVQVRLCVVLFIFKCQACEDSFC